MRKNLTSIDLFIIEAVKKRRESLETQGDGVNVSFKVMGVKSNYDYKHEKA